MTAKFGGGGGVRRGSAKSKSLTFLFFKPSLSTKILVPKKWRVEEKKLGPKKSNFSKIRSEGGGSSNFQFFPNSKKSKTSWGGDQENC